MSSGEEDECDVELPSWGVKDRAWVFDSMSAGSGLMRPRMGSDMSSSVLRFFFVGGVVASDGRFLQDRCLVPGRLSGPRRLGTASYSHSLLRRVQLWHTGLVESQRILRARLLSTCQPTRTHSWSGDPNSPLAARNHDV